MVCLARWGPWSLLGSSVTGHKLRLSIADTAVIQNGLLKAWLYTDKKTGVVQSTPGSSLSCGALLHKLQTQHAPYEHDNPDGWVAVVYFSNHVARLISAQELDELLSRVYVGAAPEAAGARDEAADESSPELQAIQAYISPNDNVHYITTFGGVEGASILTQARRYSDRFSAGPSRAAAAQTAASVVQQALKEAVSAVGNRGAVDSDHLTCDSDSGVDHGRGSIEVGYAHSEVMLRAAAPKSLDGCATPTMPVAAAHWRNSVGSEGGTTASSRSSDADKSGSGTKPPFPGLQLAAGSLDCEPNRTSGSDADGPVTFRVQPAPPAVSKAAAAAVQVLLSYLDKAHGLRVTGLAAEFILDNRQQLWLIGLSSIVLDPQQSKGNTTTFTERWTEFLAGAGPPPAPQLAQHTDFAAVAVASSPKASAGSPDRSLAAARGKLASPKQGSSVLGSVQQLNKQSSPLLSVDLADLPRARP